MKKETTGAEPSPKPAKKLSRAEYDYQVLMDHFPAPGGAGAHTAMFRAGILAYYARIPEEQARADVRKYMPPDGGRTVSDSEIFTQVAEGFARAVEESTGEKKAVAKAKPVKSRIPVDAMARLVHAGAGTTIADIVARSPVPLDFPEAEAGWRALEALYGPEEFLFIGHAKTPTTLGEMVRPVKDWVSALQRREPAAISYPHIIINPLNGKPVPTKADVDKLTLRGDGNVVRWDYVVVEMDTTSLEDQLAFWRVVPLPVRALVMSGGKSIHGWVQVDCGSREEWEREIELELFPGYLVPLGCDPQCKNESRLSRMPGHFRADKGAMQKLIYLSPEGKAVCQ